MGIVKSFAAAIAITVVSVVLLTFTRGVPTSEQFVSGSIQMFAVAFIVLVLSGAFRKK